MNKWFATDIVRDIQVLITKIFFVLWVFLEK